MSYIKFRDDLKKANVKDKEELERFIKSIDINQDNFDDWVDNLFNDDVKNLDLEKLPYVIDSLYKTDDKLLFILCCMLIEATCEDLPFITPLENYPVFEAKYQELKHTLVDVYSHVDNGIANCMALIILNKDPELKLFNEEEKEALIEATIRKLGDIIYYLDTTQEIHGSVYDDLELIIDLSIYMKNGEILNLINKLSSYNLNYSCKLFILKYKLINNMELTGLDELLNNKDEITRLVSIFENCGALDKLPVGKITQEEIARSNMIRWLEYPTELGEVPEEIELLGTFMCDGNVCYMYKFKNSNFRIKEYMLGVSGGYEKDKITARNTGWTFSNFEEIKDDYTAQAKGLVEQMKSHWKNYNSEM